MPYLWVDESELKSSSKTAGFISRFRTLKGLEKLTGADIALTFSGSPPITSHLIQSDHQDAFFIQLKHGGDILGSDQRKIELARMISIIPHQYQRYLLQIGRPVPEYQDYWREKAIHRNWNMAGVTDCIESGTQLMAWLDMLGKGKKKNDYVWRELPKPKYRLEIIDDYRYTLLSLPDVGLKTVLGLKATDFYNAIDELIARNNKLSGKIQRYLANDDNYGS